MADEQEDKPDGGTPAEGATPARETAVGHPVVEADATPAGADAAPAKDEGATEVFFSRDEPAPQPAAAPQPHTGGTSPAAADRKAGEDSDPFRQKPELYIGGAFVGAFVLAKLLKKLTGSD
jgi:hypothetical protein